MLRVDHRAAQNASQQLHVGVLVVFTPAYHQLAHAGDGVHCGLEGRRRILRRFRPFAVTKAPSSLFQ